MDSRRFNMYAGAALGSLLFFLLLNFFADLIYVGRGHYEHEPLAFAVAVEEDAGEADTAEAVDWAALLAAADPVKGEKVYGKCKSCHEIADGANKVGPYLWGVVGRAIGSATGYDYSAAMKDHGGEWTLENLLQFLESPKTFVPGTKMSFAGLPKPEDRVNVIVYLNEADGSPIELAAAASTEPAPTATDAGAATGSAPAATGEAATATPEPGAGNTPAAATEGDTESSAPTEGAPGQEVAVATPGAGDAAAGEKVFRKCRACHKVEEGKHGVGPSLWGLVGREVGSVAGYNYSDAMKAKGGTWAFGDLDTFLTDPKGVVPGTKMTFPGLKDAQDRLDVITYLNEADGSPEPLQ